MAGHETVGCPPAPATARLRAVLLELRTLLVGLVPESGAESRCTHMRGSESSLASLLAVTPRVRPCPACFRLVPFVPSGVLSPVQSGYGDTRLVPGGVAASRQKLGLGTKQISFIPCGYP
ncbi:hypothetical protein ABZP36_023020 [Zizania latifolia]